MDAPAVPIPGNRTVAVVGAAGHTGRFVVAELLRRGLRPLAVVRDASSLSPQAAWGPAVAIRSADVADAGSLAEALAGAGVVVNCAGPFLDTANAVAEAALRAGIHYLDVTAEQASAAATLERYDGAARRAGVLALPAMGFFGGFADLLATAAAGDWDAVEAVEIAIALDSWRPTRGTRVTGSRNTAPRLIVDGGRLTALPQPPPESAWDFAPPFGRQDVVALPFSEVVLMSRWAQAREIRTWLNRAPLSDLRDAATPPPEPADGRGRSAQLFRVEAVVRKDGRSRRAGAEGRDIYAFTAPFVCEAVARILDGRTQACGARSPSEVFPARDYLAALTADVTCSYALEAE